MKIAETVPVPYGSEPRTHGGEPAIGGFDEGRIVLEMDALLAGWPGSAQLDGIKDFHALVRYNGSPVMAKNDYRQDIAQNDVHNYSSRKRNERFTTGCG